MIKLHLRRLGSTYIPCGLFAKDLERIKKFQRNRQFRFLKELLDKACFAHDAAYSDSKDLAKGTISDKTLKDKAFEIAINRRYDEYQKGLVSMVIRK